MECRGNYHLIEAGWPYCYCGKQSRQALPIVEKKDPLQEIREQLDRIERKIDDLTRNTNTDIPIPYEPPFDESEDNNSY